MILKIANKQLKQPIELSIPDERWATIQALPNKDEVNRQVQILVTKHLMTHGYSIGFCDEQKTTVTLNDCMKCGVSKGWGRGPENLVHWEECKHNHINYDFSPARVLTNTIKDEKIVAKINNQSEAEARKDRQTFGESARTGAITSRDPFEQASDQVMEKIKEKENKL
jgi:hypothetical protein